MRGLRREVARLKTTVKCLVGTLVPVQGLVVLNYHRIGDGRRAVFDRGLWSATEEGFDEQLRWLQANFDVISPREIEDALEVKRGRHALITFDDGYADNYWSAFRILRARRLPATFFVATGFIDHGWRVPWWDELAWMVRTSARDQVALPGHLPDPIRLDDLDRERAIGELNRTYRRIPLAETGAFLDAVAEATGTGRHPGVDGERLWMSWDMIREMRAAGMTIGGHTVSHVMLSRLGREGQTSEVCGCGRRLREELGEPMRAFAYPHGKPGTFNDHTVACLRDAGVEHAFTYFGGFSRPGRCDPYAIPRLEVEQEHTLHEFRAAALAPWLGTT